MKLANDTKLKVARRPPSSKAKNEDEDGIKYTVYEGDGQGFSANHDESLIIGQTPIIHLPPGATLNVNFLNTTDHNIDVNRVAMIGERTRVTSATSDVGTTGTDERT